MICFFAFQVPLVSGCYLDGRAPCAAMRTLLVASAVALGDLRVAWHLGCLTTRLHFGKRGCFQTSSGSEQIGWGKVFI